MGAKLRVVPEQIIIVPNIIVGVQRKTRKERKPRILW